MPVNLDVGDPFLVAAIRWEYPLSVRLMNTSSIEQLKKMIGRNEIMKKDQIDVDVVQQTEAKVDEIIKVRRKIPPSRSPFLRKLSLTTI